jgi:hypothetical protein
VRRVSLRSGSPIAKQARRAQAATRERRCTGVRLERLVIDSGGHTFTADFHPKLTVIGGLEPASREALAGEVIDSLAGARPGVHLELEAGGRNLTVFRPATGRHRVIDTDSIADVTEDYLGADGSIDLFASQGVERALARRTMRLTQDDLSLRGGADELVARLATVDQRSLWQAADRLGAADRAIEAAAADTGTSATDVAVVNAVEDRHRALVAATETYERIRLISLTIGDVAAIAGVALMYTESVAAGAPFVLLALAGLILALYYRRNVGKAKKAERDVLSAAGASDYGAFHLERVSALLDSDNERRAFMRSVGEHRQAAEAWERMAGDISLSFAVAHRSQIEGTARLQHGVGALQHLSDSTPEVPADVTAELAQALISRIEALRALTAGDETLPLVVDDPFEGLEPTMKPMLLEMLSASAGSPQLVILTADDDVTSWARVESLTGELAVVEPTLRPSNVG